MNEEFKKARFMQLYEPVHLSFQRYCRSRTTSEVEARDLISESILVAFQGLNKLRDDAAFLGYLFGIASRLIKKRHRREKFWKLFDYRKASTINDTSPNPEQSLDVQFLYEAIRKLPEPYQEAVVLHCISGFSLQEVTQIQKSTLSAVKVRVMRGKLKLKKLLNHHELNSSSNNSQLAGEIKDTKYGKA